MDAKKIRILCVEDDKDSCEMINRFLQLANAEYLITTAEDGAEAMSLIEDDPFDLYILDNWLPGMDGMELCRRIRQAGSKRPIVFFSAMVRNHDRESALEAGADAYLLKPKDLDILAETVENLLNTDPSAN